MRIVNRSACMVKPKQPYVDWANSLDEQEIAPDTLSGEHRVYLLPEWDDAPQFQRWLRKNYLTIFENELQAMWQDETDWPAIRDYKTFRAWFDIEYGSEVFDLSGRPLEAEGESASP